MLGGVNPAKGTWEFVQALRLVQRQVPNVHFLVLGHFPGYRGFDTLKSSLVRFLHSYQRRIERFIQRNGLSSHITFAGARSDIPQILADVELVVFPSTVPHFARPIIEAGAMAKPVVASDLGGPRELVVDGETGLLVPPSDPVSLAKAIVEVLANHNLARQMGEAGYQRAKCLFDAKLNAQQTVNIYLELLADHKA